MKTGGIDKLDIDFLFGEGEFVLVASRWNNDIVDKLVEGAMKELSLQGVDQNKIGLIRVPGAFEIPLMCQQVINRGEVLAIIALGVIIRGVTFDGERWRLATVGDWNLTGSHLPQPSVIKQLRSLCYDLFALFPSD